MHACAWPRLSRRLTRFSHRAKRTARLGPAFFAFGPGAFLDRSSDVRPLDMIQKRSEKCAAASHALTLKPFTLEWKGVSGDACHSGSAPVVAPAPPPLQIFASACGGRLRLWASGGPCVACGRAARPPQGRLQRGHGTGGAQCPRVESRRDSLLAAEPAVRSPASVVHITDCVPQPAPLARACGEPVRSA